MSSLQPLEMEVRADSADYDDTHPNDAKFASLPHNTPLPSHLTLYLQNSGCPNCVSRCWQSYEQLRWKISTYRCLLHHPFRSCGNSRIQNITLFDILLFLLFILCEFLYISIFFVQQMATETFSFRMLSLVVGRTSVFSFAIAWTLATRNSFWFILFGIPFERALFYHLAIARLAILETWMHFVFMLYYWWSTSRNIDTILSNLFVSTNTAGLMALICVTLILILSLNYCRRNVWELFLKTHWMLFVLFFYFAIKHHYAYIWHNTYWMRIAIVSWLLDVVYRAYLSFLRPLICKKDGHLNILQLQSLPGNIVKLTVQTNKHYASCGPGQYFFVCIPAITVTQWHPFSVANNDIDPNTNKESITFYIKAAGDWTHKLDTFVTECNRQSVENSLRFDVDKVPVLMEGPYGKVAYPLEKYGSVVLIGGGIGITVIQNIFDHLMRHLHHNNMTSIKRIHFVWISRDPHNDTVQEFNQIHWKHVECMKNKNGFSHKFRVNKTVVVTNYFFTRCANEDAVELNRFEGVRLERPSIDGIIDQAKDYDSNCAVFSCGPTKLMEVVTHNANRRGVDSHTEVFNF
eukprot:157130_1